MGAARAVTGPNPWNTRSQTWRVLFLVAQLDAVIRTVFDTLIEGLTADRAELRLPDRRGSRRRGGGELLALGRLTLLFQGMPHQSPAEGPEPRANRRPRPGMVMGLVANDRPGACPQR